MKAIRDMSTLDSFGMRFNEIFVTLNGDISKVVKDISPLEGMIGKAIWSSSFLRFSVPIDISKTVGDISTVEALI